MTTTTKVIGVAGSHDWDGRITGCDEWWRPCSDWFTYMRPFAVLPISETMPFMWSTSVSGINPFGSARLNDWRGAGAGLFTYVVPVHEGGDDNAIAARGRDTVIVCFSHGLQVVLMACAEFGLRVDRLISVGGPIRPDMMRIAERARPRIRHWTSVFATGALADMWQRLGSIGIFDGYFGWTSGKHPLSDVGVGFPGIGHGGILRNQLLFHHWHESGLVDTIHGYGITTEHVA